MLQAFIPVTTLTIAALLCAVVALVLAYRNIYYSLSVSSIGLFLSWLEGDTGLWKLVFWLCASGVAGMLVYLLPDDVNKNRAGVMVMVTGGITGMAVGMAIGTMAGLILATIIGIIFGAMVFSNFMPNPDYKFPSRAYMNYIMAKGLPIAVVMCIVGIIIAADINHIQ